MQEISSQQLQSFLENGQSVTVLDIRPAKESLEWNIPESKHLPIYDLLKAGEEIDFSSFEISRERPVVVYCGSGNLSKSAATQLEYQGYIAYSLAGGMKGWSLAWNKAIKSFGNFNLTQIRRTGKGCLSYLVESEGEAIIVDPSLPVSVYTGIAEQLNSKIKLVTETHIHADHLSRARQLSDLLKVPLHLPVPNDVVFEYRPLHPNEHLSIGKITIEIIQTPGHTSGSVCFLINKEVLLSGDTLFLTGVGRPDLNASTIEVKQKAEQLFYSIRSLFSLHNEIIVFPAHADKPIQLDNELISTTIGKLKNQLASRMESKAGFVDQILLRIPPTPPNYSEIVAINNIGELDEKEHNYLESGPNRCAVS